MSVAELQTKVTAAKKAYKANKDDKSLKAAYKAVKAELEAAQAAEASGSKKRKASEDAVKEEAPAKKAKTASVEDLKAAAEAAKKAYKANKADKSLKAAYKEAKAAVEAAEKAAEAAPAEEAKEEAAAPVSNLNSLKKNKPAAANANGDEKEPTNKLWVGNLSFKLQDEDLHEFFKDCGKITNIHYLKHRDTQKFKGCGFIEFGTVEEAKKGFALAGQELLGREINIDFATPRPAGRGGAGGNREPRPLSERPDNCTTVFAGNLSYEIDEDAMYKFAEGCGEIKGIRWLTDRESGDFKGCGFIEFHDSESVDKFVKKNGEALLGRPVRLDYSAPRAPRN